MSRRILIVLLVLVVAMGAIAAGGAASDWQFVRGKPFPINQNYVAIALDGQPFDDKSRIVSLYYIQSDVYMLYAYAGCNHLRSEVTFWAGGLYFFKGSWMTEQDCPGKMNTEKLYFDALRRTKHWRIAEEKLTLRGVGDVLQFEAAAN